MHTTEMVLFAHFLKTSKFIPACISIYILSLPYNNYFRNSINEREVGVVVCGAGGSEIGIIKFLFWQKHDVRCFPRKHVIDWLTSGSGKPKVKPNFSIYTHLLWLKLSIVLYRVTTKKLIKLCSHYMYCNV